MKSRLLFHIAGLLFPARCHGCDRIIQRDVFLCDDCLKKAERLENPCIGCGKPEGECECGKNDFKLNITAPFAYTGSIVKIIIEYNGEKFHAKSPDDKDFSNPFNQDLTAEEQCKLDV